MKEYLKHRFAALLIIVGEWLFATETCNLPVAWVVIRFGGTYLKFKLGDKIIMKFTLPNDHPDVPFTLDPITGAQDAEGEDLAAEDFSLSDVVSTDDTVVSIVDAEEGSGKAAHIAHSGAALLSSQPLYKGEPFGQPITAEFSIHTGVPTTIEGGGFNFPSLTPDVE